MKNKRGLFWILTGLLLLVAALFLTGYNLFQQRHAAMAAQEAAAQLTDRIFTHPAAETPSADTQAVDAIPPTPADTAEQVIPDYILNPEMDMPVVNLNGIDYIGILQIPALDLTLPVCSQWSYSLLQGSPCRYEGSAYTDNLILMAHNYDAHFGRLKDLALGETVLFTDADENTFRYEVSARETLLPTATEEMSSGDWPLTLFTCTLGGANRVTIRCERSTAP